MNNLEVALTKCFYCGKDHGLVMNTILTPEAAKKVKEMHGKCVDMTPCPECKKLMEQGIMLISCKDNNRDYRTGKMAVVKEDAVKLWLAEMPELLEQVLAARYCIIEDSAWEKLGLPTEEQ